MLKKIVALALLCSFSTPILACTTDGEKGFLPENDLWISKNDKNVSNIDELEFNRVIDKVVNIYGPIISQMGHELKVLRNWDDGTVNAYASRRGGTWNIAMFGGLARHETITSDGFALVVCHEIGHHIGGAPKKYSVWGTWASNEGQSDYFATSKCLRKMFREDGETESVLSKLDIPESVQTTCDSQFSEELDKLICQRGAMAGLSTAMLFKELRRQEIAPKFTTQDSNRVSETDDSHPATQCRLDTYYAGALCSISDMVDVDQEDEAVGVCYRKAGDTVGVRPLCWFKPKDV